MRLNIKSKTQTGIFFAELTFFYVSTYKHVWAYTYLTLFLSPQCVLFLIKLRWPKTKIIYNSPLNSRSVCICIYSEGEVSVFFIIKT